MQRRSGEDDGDRGRQEGQSGGGGSLARRRVVHADGLTLFFTFYQSSMGVLGR